MVKSRGENVKSTKDLTGNAFHQNWEGQDSKSVFILRLKVHSFIGKHLKAAFLKVCKSSKSLLQEYCQREHSKPRVLDLKTTMLGAKLAFA